MFTARRRRSNFHVFMSLCDLTYLSAVRKIRQGHANAFVALLMSVLQGIMFVAAFYAMFAIMGIKGAAVRGNFLVYLLTGVYMYLTHIKALTGIMSSEGPASTMMQHAPMNTLVAILSSALKVLYLQFLSVLIILFLVHVLIEPVEIAYWPGALFMFLLAWFSGVCIGLVLLAAKPWIPDIVGIFQQIWVRANMIASGKMFVANTIGSSMVALFSWNPLFHIIDQARGFTFDNYFPHYTNWEYPLYFCLVLTLIGFVGEHVTRKFVSVSWSARR